MFKQIIKPRDTLDTRISPSKIKVAKPKEASFEVTPQDELPKVTPPKVELPSNENKLFDQDDDEVASSIPDVSVASEVAKENKLPLYGIMLLKRYSGNHQLTLMVITFICGSSINTGIPLNSSSNGMNENW